MHLFMKFPFKTLFVRMEYNNNEDSQINESIDGKQQLPDILIELIKLGFSANKGLIKKIFIK